MTPNICSPCVGNSQDVQCLTPALELNWNWPCHLQYCAVQYSATVLQYADKRYCSFQFSFEMSPVSMRTVIRSLPQHKPSPMRQG